MLQSISALLLGILLLGKPAHSGFFVSKAVIPAAVPSTNDLAETLSRAFPSTIHQSPVYASVLGYLNSLESKPTCHRSATASLISDCSMLDEPSGDLRYYYAAQLAVCEFAATGIVYPSECKGLSSNRGRHIKCIKRLEERPQWWTTMSNNIQNAIVICAAVRHEVEKEKLLDLHRNVTKAQESLLKAMDSSLNEVWNSQVEQKAFEGSWRGFITRIRADMEEIWSEVAGRLKSGGQSLENMLTQFVNMLEDAQTQNMAGLENLNNAFHENMHANTAQAEKAQHAWEAANDVISRLSSEQHQKLSRVLNSIEELNSLLYSSTAQTATSLHSTASALSTELQSALLSVHDLTSLPDIYARLLNTHSALTTSQAAQELRQHQLLVTLEALETRVNAMVDKMLAGAARVERSLDDADTRIQTMGGVFNKSYLSLGILTFSLVLWIGHNNLRSLSGGVGMIVGATMFWNANSDLFNWPSLEYETLESDISLPSEDFYVDWIIFVFSLLCSSILIALGCGATWCIAKVWKRYRGSTGMATVSDVSEKLPI